MASEIKTRIARKDIKAIDKAATIAQHMKHSSVQIKERAEQTQEQREHSPVEYAQGRIADNAERVSRGAAAQVKNQSGKAVKHVKEKQRLKREEKQIRKELREGRIPEQGERPSFSPSGGEKGYQPKEQMIKTAQSQAARKRAAENSRKHLQKKTAQIVRTVERRERDIKTTHRAEKAVKSVGKGSVKTAGHSVKTAEQTARTTVKTTEQAAKNAGIHEVIQALPKGYQTVVGRDNAYLSGGEKQRLAIARVFLKDAPIVILDEATAYADAENEAKIQAAFAKLARNKTVLMIAHRLKTVERADQLLVMERGRLVGAGTHGGLLETCPVYRAIADSQMQREGA